MSEPKKKLCDTCHKREAIYHSLTITDGVELDRELCSECFKTSAVTPAREMALLLENARCQYCDAWPSGVDFAPLRTALGIQRTHCMCLSCSEEYYPYLKEMLDDLPTGSSREEEVAAIRKLFENADRHMQQWVKKRE